MPSRRQRKLRAAEGTRQGSDTSVAQLFVRNLDFSVTAEDLEDAFSEIGPVRRSFIITENGRSRGFGFVLFATREDAQAAVEQMEGRELKGRAISVQLARRKGARGTPPALRDTKAKMEAKEEEPEDVEPKKEQESSSSESESDDDSDSSDEGDEDDEAEKQEEATVVVDENVGEAAAAAAAAAPVEIKEEEDVEAEARVKVEEGEAKPAAKKGKKGTKKVKVEVKEEVKQEVEAEPGTLGAKGKSTKKKKQQQQHQEAKQQRKDAARKAKMTPEEWKAFEEDRRTLVLQNLAAATTKKKLFQKMRKYGTVKRIQMEGKGTAHVTFKDTPAAATKFMRDVVLKLHQHELHGSVISAHVKTKPNTPVATKKDARLIVRNLDFSCTEDDLRRAFSRFGKLQEATIVKDAQGRSKGFGFVMLSNPLFVKKAVKHVNGRELNGRAIAVDFALKKSEYEVKKKQKQEEEKIKQEMKLEEDEEDKEEEDDDGEEDDDDDDDDDDDEADAMDEEEDDESDESDEEDTHDGSYGVADGRTLFINNIPVGVKTPRLVKTMHAFGDTLYCRILRDHETGESRGRGFVKFKTKDAADACLQKAGTDEGVVLAQQRLNIDRAKPREVTRVSDATEGHTVFVRNVSLDATAEEVKALMSQFGDVAYALLVTDKKTQLPKGTAFVRFSSKAEADACIEGANNPEVPLMLDGRELSVSRAMPKQEVEAAQKERKEKPKEDRRNLYLMREGAIPTDHPTYLALSDADKQKRQRLEAENKAKAKNPNNSVSTTRLTFHNLPVAVDEKQLRELVQKTIGKVKLPQVKIVRNEERTGPDGKPRSRGFGFVQFLKHDHALEALRKLNNNPSVFGKQRRPIVQFAWENALVIHAYKKKVERLKARQEQLRKAALLNDDKLVIDRSGEEQVVGGKSGSGKRDAAEAEGDGSRTKKAKKSKKQKKHKQKSDAKGAANGATTTAATGDGAETQKKRKQKQKQGRGPRDELDVIAAGAEAEAVGRKPKQPRRVTKKQSKEDAREAAFDNMVHAYKKKLEVADMMEKWM